MPNYTRIIMFRHGETDWNRDRKWQGHTDIPLNATGHSQAEKLSELLQHEAIAHIFSSDLSRALKTAEAVSRKHGCQITSDARLRELNLGTAEGVLHSKIPELFGSQGYERFFSNHDWDFKFPTGESKSEHKDRLLAFIHEVAPRFLGKTIALSSHGGSLHRIYCAYWHDLSQKVEIPNCAHIIFTVTRDLKIAFLDQTTLPFRRLV